MKGEHNGHGDDGHVDAQAEVRQKGALVGAVVAGVRGLVLKEQGPKEGPDPEGGGQAGAATAAAAAAVVAHVEEVLDLDGSAEGREGGAASPPGAVAGAAVEGAKGAVLFVADLCGRHG